MTWKTWREVGMGGANDQMAIQDQSSGQKHKPGCAPGRGFSAGNSNRDPLTRADRDALAVVSKCVRAGCRENRGGDSVTVRVGFDMDGVLADFAKAYREVDASLFGDSASIETAAPDQSPPSGRREGARAAAPHTAEAATTPSGRPSGRRPTSGSRSSRSRKAPWPGCMR